MLAYYSGFGTDIRQSARNLKQNCMHNSIAMLIPLIKHFSIPIRYQNISEAATLNLNNNPAHEAQTPLQRNIAYEDTTLTTSKPRPKESQALTNTQELAYEIVPLISCQSASNATNVLENREGDEHKKPNRDIFQQK